MKRMFALLAATILTLPQAWCAEPVFVESYEEAVSKEDTKVLVIFGAKWCKYCRILKDDLKSLDLDDYTVCVVDIDVNKDLARKYKAKSLPTSVVLENNKEMSRHVGYEKEGYQAWLNSNREDKGK